MTTRPRSPHEKIAFVIHGGKHAAASHAVAQAFDVLDPTEERLADPFGSRCFILLHGVCYPKHGACSLHIHGEQVFDYPYVEKSHIVIFSTQSKKKAMGEVNGFAEYHGYTVQWISWSEDNLAQVIVDSVQNYIGQPQS